MAKVRRMRQDRKRPTAKRTFTADLKAKYLESLAETGDVAFARLDVGFSHDTISKHRRKDAEFAQGVEDALVRYRKQFVDELVRRGKDGVEEPVFHQGVIVGYVTRYSDRLLLEHLKVIDPRYQTKVNVEQTTQVTTTDLDLKSLQPESRKLLAQIIEIENNARRQADAE